MQHPTIHIEGGILPADLLDQIAPGEAPGQREADFQHEILAQPMFPRIVQLNSLLESTSDLNINKG